MCFGFFFFSFLGKKKWIGLYFPQIVFFTRHILHINYSFFFFLLCFLPKKKKELFYSQLDFISFPKTCSAHILFFIYTFVLFLPTHAKLCILMKNLGNSLSHCWAKDVGTGLTNLCSHTPNYLCLVLSILIWTHTSRCIL